jgi:hypothetical protein
MSNGDSYAGRVYNRYDAGFGLDQVAEGAEKTRKKVNLLLNLAIAFVILTLVVTAASMLKGFATAVTPKEKEKLARLKQKVEATRARAEAARERAEASAYPAMATTQPPLVVPGEPSGVIELDKALAAKMMRVDESTGEVVSLMPRHEKSSMVIMLYLNHCEPSRLMAKEFMSASRKVKMMDRMHAPEMGISRQAR